MKPILFNTDMVRAILEGRKTVTRRVVKLKYDNTHLELFTNKYGTRLIEIENEVPGVTTVENPDGTTTRRVRAYIERASPYRPGDILYVRETWRIWRAHRYDADAHIEFRAGGEGTVIRFPYGCTDSVNRDNYDRFIHKWGVRENKWHPSIHMPREAARIFLRVTDVRVEQLRDITWADALKEGCEQPTHFDELWDSTIKKADRALYGWEADPWVWAIEFERCERQEATP